MPVYPLSQMVGQWEVEDLPNGTQRNVSVRILDFKVLCPVISTPQARGEGNDPLDTRYATLQTVEDWEQDKPPRILLKVKNDGTLVHAWTELEEIAPEDRMMEQGIEQGGGGDEDKGEGEDGK